VTAHFTATEVGLLRTLLDDLLNLLDLDDPMAQAADPLERALGIGGNTRKPRDAALARLLPDAYRDDEQASAEFRRYTEADLRAGKRAHARVVLTTLGRVGHGHDRLVLDEDEASAWLGTLNDLRLALATRMDITDDHEQLHTRYSPGDPRGMLVPWYLWLGWLQETLIDALS
jgi:hypothetical protein